MAYPKEMKERAKELSKIYGSAAKVLAALGEEFPGKVPFNERTIRRWFKWQDKQHKKSKEEHSAHLLEMVNMLLENGVSKAFGIPTIGEEPEADDYSILSRESDFEKIPRGYLIERIENNIKHICETYSVWDFWECFLSHLMAETKRQDFTCLYNDHTIEFINILRMLAQRKTFKGNCPVCKGW